jgi:hypothetical protein
LPTGNFTAIVSGKNGETGGGLSTSFIRFDDVTALRHRHFHQQRAIVYGS